MSQTQQDTDDQKHAYFIDVYYINNLIGHSMSTLKYDQNIAIINTLFLLSM